MESSATGAAGQLAKKPIPSEVLANEDIISSLPGEPTHPRSPGCLLADQDWVFESMDTASGGFIFLDTVEERPPDIHLG